MPSSAVNEKDLGIPAELAKAFEVNEIPAAAPAAPTPAIEPDPVLKSKASKKESKKKTKAAVKKAEPKPAEGMAGPGTEGFKIPNRRPQVDPLQVGEKVWMDVTWLGTKAGEFILEVLPFKMMNGRKVYEIKGSAKTTDIFAMVYEAKDYVQSFVDYEGWFPYKFVLHGDETKHIRNHLELFDHAAKKQYVHIHDNRIQKKEIHEKKGFFDLQPYSQDSLSALYFARTFKLENGQTYRFPMSTSGNQVETEIVVIGREEVNTKMGYLKAIKTKVQTRFNGVLQQKGDAFIWFSDDARKLVLRFEAKVRIGWVAGIAKKVELGSPEPVAPTPSPEKTSLVDHPKGGSITNQGAGWLKQVSKASEITDFEKSLEKAKQ